MLMFNVTEANELSSSFKNVKHMISQPWQFYLKDDVVKKSLTQDSEQEYGSTDEHLAKVLQSRNGFLYLTKYKSTFGWS